MSDPATPRPATDPEGLAALTHLARLELPDAERAALGEHLGRILGWVAELEQVETTGVSPSHHGAPRSTESLRPDEVRPSLERERALLNAPASDPLGFLVPRVVSE
jgi:aspartyl-tRNA(Asn)/glutamyl-tRNA(Gln) amidotransferase subunit C